MTSFWLHSSSKLKGTSGVEEGEAEGIGEEGEKRRRKRKRRESSKKYRKSIPHMIRCNQLLMIQQKVVEMINKRNLVQK